MNYLISYKTHGFASPIITFQVIKSESKIDAVKHLLDNHQETVDILAISEIDDELTAMIGKCYKSESQHQSSTVEQKIEEGVKIAQIWERPSDKVNRKLEDYTLKEVKQLCRQQLDCPDCPFYNEEFDCCLLVDKIPDSWEL